MVLSKVALTGGSFILLNKPFPHGLGKKNVLALECANARKPMLERDVARASAQSISFMSVSNVRFCGDKGCQPKQIVSQGGFAEGSRSGEGGADISHQNRVER